MDLDGAHRLAVTVAREAGGLLRELIGRAHTVERKPGERL